MNQLKLEYEKDSFSTLIRKFKRIHKDASIKNISHINNNVS